MLSTCAYKHGGVYVTDESCGQSVQLYALFFATTILGSGYLPITLYVRNKSIRISNGIGSHFVHAVQSF